MYVSLEINNIYHLSFYYNHSLSRTFAAVNKIAAGYRFRHQLASAADARAKLHEEGNIAALATKLPAAGRVRPSHILPTWTPYS